MKQDSSLNDSEDIIIDNPFKNFSFFNYIHGETVTPNVERKSSIYENRKERIYTFLSIPMNLESFLLYASIICSDHFLWLHTFLPVRCFLVPYKWSKRMITMRKGCWAHVEEIEDCFKLSIIVLVTCIMCHVDTSVIYHQIRSQSVIKLYLFFNLLEVLDRLLSPLSQDFTDALSWPIGKSDKRKQRFFNFIGYYVLTVCCFLIHVIVMISQTTILNVAFNSHNPALLTIMLSNNFIELKGNVFRKVEKTNLFQMSCADSRERFHYFIMLGLVVLRNLTETGWNTDDVWSMLQLISFIMLTEVIIDWVKHAFVTKFNFITADVYKEFSVSLAYDLLQCRMGKSNSSQFELFGRRMGLTSIPLACLVNVFLLKSFKNRLDVYLILVILFGCFVVKLFVNILLVSRSFSIYRAYVTADNTKDNTTSNKDSSFSHTQFKPNDYDIVLPSLKMRHQNSFSIIKRTLSFSEGLTSSISDKLDDDSISSKQLRSARSSSAAVNLYSFDYYEPCDLVEPNGELINNESENVMTICGNKPLSLEKLTSKSKEDNDVITRRRSRTISNITDDLSDALAEPLIIQTDEASGVCADINVGSKGLFMNVRSSTESIIIDEEHNRASDVEHDSRLPFGDVIRFSMYINQIV